MRLHELQHQQVEDLAGAVRRGVDQIAGAGDGDAFELAVDFLQPLLELGVRRDRQRGRQPLAVEVDGDPVALQAADAAQRQADETGPVVALVDDAQLGPADLDRGGLRRAAHLVADIDHLAAPTRADIVRPCRFDRDAARLLLWQRQVYQPLGRRLADRQRCRRRRLVGDQDRGAVRQQGVELENPDLAVGQ